MKLTGPEKVSLGFNCLLGAYHILSVRTLVQVLTEEYNGWAAMGLVFSNSIHIAFCAVFLLILWLFSRNAPVTSLTRKNYLLTTVLLAISLIEIFIASNVKLRGC